MVFYSRGVLAAVAMAVYLYTLHAYRSWMPDHRRGYVRRGEGILPPDAQQARSYHRLARHERMVFDDARCDAIIESVRELCDRKPWRLHAAVVVWTHAHVLLSWPTFYSAKRGRAVLKRAITTWLRDRSGDHRQWLAGGGSVKRVRDQQHFEHLVKRYLPDHGKYGGRQWYEA